MPFSFDGQNRRRYQGCGPLSSDESGRSSVYPRAASQSRPNTGPAGLVWTHPRCARAWSSGRVEAFVERRDFLRLAGAAAVMPSTLAKGAEARRATVLYDDAATVVDDVRDARDPTALWIRKNDLPRINKFEVKPQGACRDDIC